MQWLLSSVLSSSALAQGSVQRSRSVWPRQPVQMLVPFPAGGPSAILSKHLGKSFERMTSQPMRLNYQSGAGGVAAASVVAKSAADGNMLFMGGSHLATARALFPSDDFDFLEDLRPLALVANIPQVLLVNPSRMRSRTAMEWISDLSRKPVRYRMATSGIGSSSHIYSELLKQHEKLELDFVHFRGSGPALQDLLNGAADTMVDGLISCLPHVRSGRLKALMVSGNQRVPVLPDIPCAHEMGVDIVNSVTWYGIFAPSKLPDTIAVPIIRMFEQLGQDPELHSTFASLGIQWGQLSGNAFADMVKADTLKWAQILKNMNMGKLLKPSLEG